MFVERILPGARERLVTIAVGAPLMEAARLLGEAPCGLVVVCDGDGRMAGVASKTDIVRRIGICLGHACTIRVADVMARDVAFCRPGDRLQDAWSTMKQRGRHELPVVDDDSKPLGGGERAARPGGDARQGRARGGAAARLRARHRLPLRRRARAHRFTASDQVVSVAERAGHPGDAAVEVHCRRAVGCAARRECILMVQALAEFYHATTRKRLLEPAAAGAFVRDWLEVFPVASADAAALADAIDAVEEHRLSFWGAMLWATARLAGCGTILSEDMQGGAG